MKPTTQAFKSTEIPYSRNKMFFTILFLFVVFCSFSQQKISGKITDVNHLPLPGVSVLEKNTTNAVTSDFDGNFEITTKGNNVILVFSYVGLKRKEVQPDGKTLNVILESDLNELTEVVVVGYGTQKKERVTSAIATIKEKDFTRGAIRDASDLIRGKVAGLTISNGSGDPAASSNISLRGVSTLQGNAGPLVLINGVPGGMNTVAPNDIASIDILKDASAAAIYGTRGANGVILITTKTVNKDIAPTITYSTFATISNFYNKADFLDATQQRNFRAQGLRIPYKDGGADTNWLDQISGSGFAQNHNLALKGGNVKTNYTVNLNYIDETGVFTNTFNKEYRFSFDVNHSMFNDKLKINLNLLNGTQNMGLSEGTVAYAYRQAMIRNPSAPIYNSDGTYLEKEDGQTKFQYYNPVGIINETIEDRNNTWQRFTANLTLDLLPGWDVGAQFSKNKNTGLNGYAETKKHYSNTINSRNGVASRNTGTTDTDLVEITSKYHKILDKHEFTVLGGYSYQYIVNQGFSASNSDFPTDAFSYNNLGSGNALTDGLAGMGSYKDDNTLIGFFGRVNYNFNSKYDLLVSIRREGSSKFGANYQWGNFPAVSAGWSINKESFLKDVEIVNALKLRAGYGVTGVIPNDPYMSLTLYNYGDYFYNDGKWVRGLEPVSNPNPDLRWEKTTEVNIGLDFGFFNNRISGSVDVYSKKTSDMLWRYAVPRPPNIYDSTIANVGKMENKGIEILLNTIPVKTDDFLWNSSMTFSHNKNKLTSLSNNLYQIEGDYVNRGNTGDPISFDTHRLEVGQSLGNFWGLKSVDITDDGQWIVELPDGTRKTLDPSMYNDTNKQYLGNGIPQYYAGWTNTFSYKNFDLSMVLTGAFDFQILNSQRMFYGNSKTDYNMLSSTSDKVYGKAVLNYNPTYVSYYIEQGDYVKVDNITLSYNFDVKPFKFINAMRLYVSGNNLATFTKYKGLDPEIKREDPTSQGMDNRDKYPSITGMTLGLNVTF
ncbi:SusC/RagA family TonB-linked outer membrane protein [Flavobacterium chungangense]|uniref:SusC/RagA family TonB-linked outer membrane protein n=1 Tax=Flavobacterium chungangense TaxID=554283 RepID=A0A6V6YWB2_9FLAO|nr:SusC/RagA family TonB-linked outer membrane protein [Flavobacterium chungangense]CAD0003781.1 SusC/RagA family TonB-linked outer membrane protein [Flavobacterium chungangense]